jgi:SPP1 gp7 family putative phage head morphogenesis protein
LQRAIRKSSLTKWRNQQLDAVDAKALASIRKVVYTLRQEAVRELMNGDRSSLPALMSRKLVNRSLPILVDSMVTSDLIARQKYKALSLSVFDTQITMYQKMLNMTRNQTRTLKESYRATALIELISHAKGFGEVFTTVIQELLLSGATTREAVRAIDERMERSGFTGEKPYQLHTLYRTASALAFGAGKWATVRSPDIDEILWGFEYTAIDDDRTRENHFAADGTILPKEHEFWQMMWPPNGYNCRCDVIPLYQPEALVFPPETAVPDDGWGFNAGVSISAVAA